MNRDRVTFPRREVELDHMGIHRSGGRFQMNTQSSLILGTNVLAKAAVATTVAYIDGHAGSVCAYFLRPVQWFAAKALSGYLFL